MGNPIVHFLKRELVKIGCLGVAFVLFSPVYFFMLRPQDDVKYYFLRPAKIHLRSEDEPKHNQFVQVVGRIDPDTLQIHKQGVLGLKTDFKFRLEGYPDTLVVCVEEGPLHEEMLSAYRREQATPAEAKELPKLDNLIAKKLEKAVRAKMLGAEEFDPAWTRLGDILAREQTIEGRLHDSKVTFLSAFGTVASERDTRVVEYFDRILGLDARTEGCWLIDAGETPDPSRFIDGNGGLLLFGFFLGLVAIGWWVRWLFKSPAKSGRSPMSHSLPPNGAQPRHPPPLPGKRFD